MSERILTERALLSERVTSIQSHWHRLTFDPPIPFWLAKEVAHQIALGDRGRDQGIPSDTFYSATLANDMKMAEGAA